MCVVNKQFELLEFVFESVYVDLQYDEIFLTFCVACVFAARLLGCEGDGNAGVGSGGGVVAVSANIGRTRVVQQL